MSQSLTLTQNLKLPTPEEWAMIKDMAVTVFNSGLLPRGITAPQAAVITLKSRELGIPLMTGFAQIHLINNKMAMSAELIHAIAKKNLPGLILNLVESTHEKCILEGKRPEPGSKLTLLEWNLEDANRAKLLGKEVWKLYPQSMLRARATTALLRQLCPDAIMGISYTPEELGSDDLNTIETTGRSMSPSEASQEEELLQRRKMVWQTWQAAKGTQEGFKIYLKRTFNLDTMQNLDAMQMDKIENYIRVQMSTVPPAPLDPPAEKAEWEKMLDAKQE